MTLINLSWKIVKIFLKGIDSFGQPIQLSYRGRTEYKTWFGGLLTIVLIFMIAVFSYQALLSLIRRDNIKVAYSRVYENSPYRLALTRDMGFRLAIGFSIKEMNDWNRKHFELQATHHINRRLKNGTINETSREINLVPCKRKDFPSDYNFITNIQDENFLCVNMSETLVLEGRFESENYIYISFHLSKCKNSSSTQCAPYEETLKLMNENKIYFNFYFSNKIINLQNYDNPITDYLESSVFLIDPRKYYKQADIFLQQNTIIRDDNIWYFKTEESSELTFESFREQVTDIDGDVYGTFSFKSSLYRGIYIANSEKFALMLSRLGGLMSCLYAIIEIVARSYNRKKLLVSLSNLLYNFFLPKNETLASPVTPDHESTDIIDKEETPSNKKVSTVQIKVKSHRVIEDSGGGDNLEVSHEEGLVAQIKKYLKRFTKIKLNWLVLGFSFNNKKKEISLERYKLIKKALKRVEKDVDIIQILQKVKEVDKIKDFLFNDDQRTLFEFFPKPLVTLKDFSSEALKRKPTLKKKPAKRSSWRKITNEYIKKLISRRGLIDERNNAYLELFRSYNNAFISGNRPDEKNQKLISFLGPSILKIFRRHQQIVNNS